jgi:hypothetical protein
MKTSLTKLSSSLFLLTLSAAVWAKPVAQVTEVTGSVFVVSPEGKTSTLRVNQHIDDKSEIMVSSGGSITLNDYYDATYHLIAGSHLKFFDQSVQLKKGKAWVQSTTSRHPLALTTANGHVAYSKSEFIATFDQMTNRSQVLVVNGEVEFSNVLDRNMNYTVGAGTFSLIEPEIEHGIPRAPTKVGLQSLNVALAEFKQLPETITDYKPSRGIASVEEAPVKKGKIIFITSNRSPASVETQKTKKVSKSDFQPVPIKFYGVNNSQRNPASVVPMWNPTATKTGHVATQEDPQFADSLKKHESEQPKYSKELQNLIDDLKSY